MTLILDSHTHVFSPEVRAKRERFRGLDDYFSELYGDPTARIATAEELLAEMDSAGVDHAVLCGFGWSTSDLCAMHNDYLLDCVHRYPSRFSALASVQPLAVDRSIAEVERCLAGGMKGVGELMPNGQGYELNELHRIGHLFSHAGENGYVVMTHTSEPVGHSYVGKQAVTPDTVWPLVQAYPQVKLVMSHWGGGYPFYELMPEVREASRNVFYDTGASSYLYRPEVFLHVSAIVGYQKILWGSDFPVLGERRFLQRVKDLGIADDARAAILGGNAARLFGLKETGCGDG